MDNRRHGTHRIAFVRRREMMTAYLHADHHLVGCAKHHRAKTGHRFGQSQRGSAMQDTEWLTGTFVNGHSRFDTAFRGIRVLNAEISHQSVLAGRIQPVERDIGGTYIGKDRFFERHSHAVFFV